MSVSKMSDYLIEQGKTKLMHCPQCRTTRFLLHTIKRKKRRIIIQVTCGSNLCKLTFDVAETAFLNDPKP